MIRLVHCVRRRPDLSVEAFRRFWSGAAFDELLEELARATGAVRVEKNLTLLIDVNETLMQERGTAEPFDGILEVWWRQARGLQERLGDPAIREALERMTDYQRQFIDFPHSRRFFTEWASD
ncbi:MAG TPA: hypothetical protein ENK50_02510 [Sedimenticola sp.]|nr:hypothetical protein [Sedimenticola sp.]